LFFSPRGAGRGASGADAMRKRPGLLLGRLPSWPARARSSAARVRRRGARWCPRSSLPRCL